MSEEEISQESSQVPRKEKTRLDDLDQIEAPETVIEGPVCPIPPEHVKLFEECCERYQKGEMTDLDVITEVAKTLKGLKKGV